MIKFKLCHIFYHIALPLIYLFILHNNKELIKCGDQRESECSYKRLCGPCFRGGRQQQLDGEWSMKIIGVRQQFVWAESEIRQKRK